MAGLLPRRTSRSSRPGAQCAASATPGASEMIIAGPHRPPLRGCWRAARMQAAGGGQRLGKIQNRLRQFFNTKTPRIYADIDGTKAEVLRCRTRRWADTLQTYLGSISRQYVQLPEPHLPGVRAGRLASSATTLGAIGQLKTCSASPGCWCRWACGEPWVETTGPYRVLRYNLYPGAQIQGDTPPGKSSGGGIPFAESAATKAMPTGTVLRNGCFRPAAARAPRAGRTRVPPSH